MDSMKNIRDLRILQRKQLITLSKYKTILDNFYNSYFNSSDELHTFSRSVMKQMKLFKFENYEGIYAKILFFPIKEITTTYVSKLFHTLTAIGLSKNELYKILEKITRHYKFHLNYSHLAFQTQNVQDLILGAGHQKIFVRHHSE